MSTNDNESKFLNNQVDVCLKDPNEPPEKDKICPTCKPNPSYIEPNWWEQKEPYLNEKTCEYTVCVIVNDKGQAFRTSDVGQSAYYDAGTEDPLRIIRKTYIRSGIRMMLRHYAKKETDDIVCASVGIANVDDTSLWSPAVYYSAGFLGGVGGFLEGAYNQVTATGVQMDVPTVGDKIVQNAESLGQAAVDSLGGQDSARCQDLYFYDYEKYVQKLRLVSNLQEDQVVEEIRINPNIAREIPAVTNLQALELYGRAREHYFYGPNQVMAVKVTVPAYVFDFVPNAPSLGEPEVSETLEMKANDFVTAMLRLKRGLRTFEQYQAYFYKFENGSLFFEFEPTTSDLNVQGGQDVDINIQAPPIQEPFYLKFERQRVINFEKELTTLLGQNGASLPTLDKSFFTDVVTHIKFTFDTEDELNPYKLVKIEAKYNGCDYEEVKTGFSSFAELHNKNQTMMGYISNLDTITSELAAAQTPPWLDWTVKNTFPKLKINYGSSENFTNRTAMNCLMESLNGMSDFILEEGISFMKVFAYKLNSQACVLLTNSKDGTPPTFKAKKSPLGDEEILTLEQNYKEAMAEATKIISGPGSTIQGLKDSVANPKGPIRDMVGFLINPCVWKDISLTSIQCLMSGMTIEEGYRAIIEKVIGSLGDAALETLMEGLPADKKDKIRAVVETEFTDIPMPWDPNYKPGVYEVKGGDKTTQNKQNKQTRGVTSQKNEVARGSGFGIEPADAFPCQEYIVESGDSISKIAQKFSISIERLLSENPDFDPSFLRDNNGKLIANPPDRRDNDVPGGKDRSPHWLEKGEKLCIPNENSTKAIKKADEPAPTAGEDQGEPASPTRTSEDIPAAGEAYLNELSEDVLELIGPNLDKIPRGWKPINVTVAGDGYIRLLKREVGDEYKNRYKEVFKVNREIGTHKYLFAQSGPRKYWLRKGWTIFVPPNNWEIPPEQPVPEPKPKQYDSTWGRDHQASNINHGVSFAVGSDGKPLKKSTDYDFFSPSFTAPTSTNDALEKILHRASRTGHTVDSWEKLSSFIKQNGRYHHFNAETLRQFHNSKSSTQYSANQFPPTVIVPLGSIGPEPKEGSIQELLGTMAPEIYYYRKNPEWSWDDEQFLKDISLQPFEIITVQDEESGRTNIEQRSNQSVGVSQGTSAATEVQKNLSVSEKAAQANQVANNVKTQGSIDSKKRIKHEQGTYGRALGNLQKALFDAYKEAILENATVEELMAALDGMPGVKFFAEVLGKFKCPNTHWVYPPIDSFMNTLTFDPCGDGESKLGALPKLTLPSVGGWDWLKALGDSASQAIKHLVNTIIRAMIIKVASIIDSAICKGIAIAGEAAKSALLGDDRVFADIVDDAICGTKNANDPDARQQAGNAVAGIALPKINHDVRGAIPSQIEQYSSNESFKKVGDVISRTATRSEIVKAISCSYDDRDMLFMENMSRTLTATIPELAPAFDTADKTSQFFGSISNLIDPETRERLCNSVQDDPMASFPLDSSICLTKPEREEWDRDRCAMFENAGLDKQVACDFVDQMNKNARNDLGEIAEMLAQGPIEKLADDIQKAINDSDDPDCAIRASALVDKNPKQVVEKVKTAMNGLFKRLDEAFVDDVIQSNTILFIPDPFDTPGILNFVLSDVDGNILSMHNVINNSWLYRAMAWNVGPEFLGYMGKVPEFPDTVALDMRQQFLKNVQEIQYSIPTTIVEDITGIEGTEYGIITLPYENDGFTNKVKLLDYSAVERTRSSLSYTISFEDKDINSMERKLVVTPSFDQETKELLSSVEPELMEFYNLETNQPQTYKSIAFYNFIQKILIDNNVNVPSFTKQKIFSIFQQINENTTKLFCSKLLKGDGPQSVDNLPQGFKYGNKMTEVTADDLLEIYNPDTMEPLSQEDINNGVLGVSKNPRVFFLDPIQHGGTYAEPNVYIDPPKHEGWLEMSNIFVPGIDGCEESRSNFLQLEQLIKKMNDVRPKITANPQLSKPPTCVKEVPFDLIRSPSTLATLEGVVRATIRIYIAEYFIKTLPITSHIRLTDKCYDESVISMILYNLKHGLQNERSLFVSTYEGNVYWLLFLEQAVQIAKRKFDDGDFEYDEETELARDYINNIQMEYESPTIDDLLNVDTSKIAAINDLVSELKEIQRDSNLPLNELDSVLSGHMQNAAFTALPVLADVILTSTLADVIIGSSMISFGGLGLGILAMGGVSFLTFQLLTLNQAKFACKLLAIKKAEIQAETFMKHLIREELESYTKILDDRMPTRPEIFDINKYFIGASGMMLSTNQIKSGLYDVEVPIEGVVVGSYGDVNNCSPDGFEHPLSGQLPAVFPESGDLLTKRFYLEKYLKVVDKTFSETSESGIPQTPATSGAAQAANITPPIVVPNIIKNRPDHLKNIVNVSEFKNFLDNISDSIPESVNVSDFFGNATVTEEDPNYQGTIGIKFGIRVCMVTGHQPTISEYSSNRKASFENKSFILKEAVNDKIGNAKIINSEFVLPIASYEQDIPDLKLVDYIAGDENFNQDIKCYIDKLTKTPEFKLFFEGFVGTKKASSLLMAYAQKNFITSLGSFEGDENFKKERSSYGEEDEFAPLVPPINPQASIMFNDSKSEARKLFTSNYRRNDFDPTDEAESQIEALNERAKAQLSYLWGNIGTAELPWWLRNRVRRDKTTDKDGKPCQNQYAGLFNIKGPQE